MQYDIIIDWNVDISVCECQPYLIVYVENYIGIDSA